MIPDRHHGDNLLTVEVERQRAFGDHPKVNGFAAFIDARDRRRQALVLRIRSQNKIVSFAHQPYLGQELRGFKRHLGAL